MSSLQVQGTNDYSIVSKLSMVDSGYFQDEYIKHFVKKPSRRAPLINLGYYVRAVIIDFVLRSFFGSVSHGQSQVVSCGAGFDTSYFRLKGSLPCGMVFYEVDFLEVVQRKADLIRSCGTLRDAVGVELDKAGLEVAGGLLGSQYRLLPADLADLTAVEKQLLSAGIDINLPTLFLSECAITYMMEARSSALIRWAARTFLNSAFATYEQVFPHDAFGQVMLQHFESLGSPLLSVDMYPDLDSQQQRYTSLGWQQCMVRSAMELFLQLVGTDGVAAAVTHEPFDELEEWHVLCCHYSLAVASQGLLLEWGRSLSPANKPATVPPAMTCDIRARLFPSGVQRFGHQSVCLSESGPTLLIGGFGVLPGRRHGRLEGVDVLHDNGNTAVIGVARDTLHHTATLLPDGRVLVLGGRHSPLHPASSQPLLLTVHTGASGPECKSTSLSFHGNMPPRWRHSSVFLPELNCCLVFGGRTPHLQMLDDVWLLAPDGTEAKRLPYSTPWPEARCSHTMVAVAAGRLLLTGGLGASMLPLADSWLLDVVEARWSRLDLPMLPRYGHVSVPWMGHVLLVGGANTLAGRQPGLAALDVRNMSCKEFAWPSDGPASHFLALHHSAVERGDRVWVVGGGANCFSFGTYFNSGLLVLDNGEPACVTLPCTPTHLL